METSCTCPNGLSGTAIFPHQLCCFGHHTPPHMPDLLPLLLLCRVQGAMELGKAAYYKMPPALTVRVLITLCNDAVQCGTLRQVITDRAEKLHEQAVGGKVGSGGQLALLSRTAKFVDSKALWLLSYARAVLNGCLAPAQLPDAILAAAQASPTPHRPHSVW